MSLLVSVISILALVVLYSIFINIFAILFRFTGLTKSKALFQAISLFTNCGFTTRESENIVNHPGRRKLALAAMLLGNFFGVILVTLLINLVMTISGEVDGETINAILISLSSFIALIILSRIPFISRFVAKIIVLVARSFTKKKSVDNVITILDEYSSECIAEVYMRHVPEFMKDKTLYEIDLNKKYGIKVLMIDRNKNPINVTRDTMIAEEDVLVVFGEKNEIKECFSLIKNDEEYVPNAIKDANRIRLIDNYSSNAIVEVSIHFLPQAMLGKTIVEMKLKEKYKMNVLSINRFGQNVEIDANTEFYVGDIVVIFGSYMEIKKFFNID